MRDPDWKTVRGGCGADRYQRGGLLDGKVAVVTGGGEVIVAAVAMLFARHRATVEMQAIDPRSSRAIPWSGDPGCRRRRARSHVVDVTSSADVDRLAEAVLGATAGSTSS